MKVSITAINYSVTLMSHCDCDTLGDMVLKSVNLLKMIKDVD